MEETVMTPEELMQATEERRQDRWWRTHDAVLGGLYAGRTEYYDSSSWRSTARAAADEAHGPLGDKP
jgi:hypothetical protein